MTRFLIWTVLFVSLSFAIPSASGQAIGFRPVITPTPDGVFLNTAPVVSADRRYVRLGVNAQFQSIRGVDSFSFPGGAVAGGPGGPGGFGGFGGAGGFGSIGAGSGNTAFQQGSIPSAGVSGFNSQNPGIRGTTPPFAYARNPGYGIGFGINGGPRPAQYGQPPMVGSAMTPLMGAMNQAASRRGR